MSRRRVLARACWFPLVLSCFVIAGCRSSPAPESVPLAPLLPAVVTVTVNGTSFRADEVSKITTGSKVTWTLSPSGSESIFTQDEGQVEVVLISGEVVLIDPDGSRHSQKLPLDLTK